MATELEKVAHELASTINMTISQAKALELQLKQAMEHEESVSDHARFTYSHVVKAMDTLRVSGDALERMTDTSYWPYPSYEDMLFTL